jgi:cytochrome P450
LAFSLFYRLVTVLNNSPQTLAHLAEQFELASLTQEFYRDPYPTYAALVEHAPVKVLKDGSLFVTSYQDLRTIYADNRTFSSDKTVEFTPKFGPSLLLEHHTSSLVFNDPPLHTRVRQELVAALSPRAIGALQANLEVVVSGLLDNIAALHADSNCRSLDLIEHFASAIPIEVIGNLLGVPTEQRGPLRGWSLAILGALEPVLTDEQRQLGNQAVSEFLDFLHDLVAHRRRFPLDPQVDVISRLLPSLSEKELLHNCIFLLNAGHETTTNLIGNGLEALARFPDQAAKLKRACAIQNRGTIQSDQLLKTAIEECLRFESSNQLGNRRSVMPFQLRGHSYPSGTRIHLCIGAANRDPSEFIEPNRLELERSPNRHLAFGYGPHVCAGLNLARLEARVAIGAWLQRFPNYKIESSQLAGRVRFRGFKELRVELD